MTTYLGSVEKMPGHILVSKSHLYMRLIKDCVTWWCVAQSSIETGLQPIPYRFHSHEGKIYYVNGRKQVYETDIVNLVYVVFNPVGYQILADLRWHPIQFRLMEKVEWVFL
jgi:hypothetical protein